MTNSSDVLKYVPYEVSRSVIKSNPQIVRRANQIAFKLLDSGLAICPPKLPLRPPSDSESGVFLAMPVFVQESAYNIYSGIKWLGSNKYNRHKHLPRSSSLTILNNRKTFRPFCIFDSTYISTIRTAALAVEILDHLKLGDLVVGLFGYGPLGQSIIELSMGRFTFIVYNYKKRISNIDIDLRDSVEGVIRDADIIICASGSSQPYLADNLGKTTLCLAINDIEPRCLRHYESVYTDDVSSFWQSSRNIRTAFSDLGPEQFARRVHPLAEAIMGRAPPGSLIAPRGMAIQDVALASLLYGEILTRNDDWKSQNLHLFTG